jgi:hypothetical protein
MPPRSKAVLAGLLVGLLTSEAVCDPQQERIRQGANGIFEVRCCATRSSRYGLNWSNMLDRIDWPAFRKSSAEGTSA